MTATQKIPAKDEASPGTSKSGKINIELSTRFLELFSEQLYSSPQKAFEELISNGWDAGATFVDVEVAEDLLAKDATLSVLDNGTSMNAKGLQQLWKIAWSPKKGKEEIGGRPVIGKFGIGKLATYVLGNRLTYYCKASDGVIRRVTMNYQSIDEEKDKLLTEVTLDIFQVEEATVLGEIKKYSGGERLSSILAGGAVAIPSQTEAEMEKEDREFGGPPAKRQKAESNTWTLAVLSELKPTGRALQIGHLRRMLAAALPITTEMRIDLNGTALRSSKINTPVERRWIIGPEVGFNEFEVEEPDGSGKQTITLHKQAMPYPAVILPDIGPVTGEFKLYEKKISGGKAEERGASNGFFVNVKGRVVNLADNTFQEENLSHAAWASFRMTVRADGLNKLLTVHREKFRERFELRVFRAFLRKAFNLSRKSFDAEETGMPDGGDELVKSVGVVSLRPLRSLVTEALSGHKMLPGMFDFDGVDDQSHRLAEWERAASENIGNTLNEVRIGKPVDRQHDFVVYRLADNSVVINKEHPFVAEHSRSRAEKRLLQQFGLVTLLSDMYAYDSGVPLEMLEGIRSYRDRVMKFQALKRRTSGPLLAQLLRSAERRSDSPKRLEVLVGQALGYLGFDVEPMAKTGQPEGVARAIHSIALQPGDAAPDGAIYSFTYEAKTTGSGGVPADKVGASALVRHRKDNRADYTLVVAPQFQSGALEKECEEHGITPMVAADLSRLLEISAEHGAIPLNKLRELFDFNSPAQVGEWVDKLDEWIVEKRPLNLSTLLRALDIVRTTTPDAVDVGTIVHICRTSLNVRNVVKADVSNFVKGLEITVPDLIGLDGDQIVVFAQAAQIAEAVQTQLEKLRTSLEFGSHK